MTATQTGAVRYELRQGDCREVMAQMSECSVDAIVTDPPYGIGFMGKKWDNFKPGYRADNWKGYDNQPKTTPSMHAGKYDLSLRASREFQEWTESWAVHALRVLKPGGYMLVCGGPRTYHRMTCGLEDAGFEIRDCLMWLFGSGFPKSLNLHGERQGWGTALKPAYEPIVLARKPLIGTVAANVQRYGTGGLNIDACRIGTGGQLQWAEPRDMGYHGGSDAGTVAALENKQGRWPANVLLDTEAARLLDAMTGESNDGTAYPGNPEWEGREGWGNIGKNADRLPFGYGQRGGASRFFYTSKASRAEREFGLGDLPAHSPGELTERKDGAAGTQHPRAGAGRAGRQGQHENLYRRNDHATVKPVDLMRWLCTLVTPPGGTILDPFCGSGSTGMAALDIGARFIGIDLDAHYLEIAQRRIARRHLLEAMPPERHEQGSLL